jgi:hypothetical protein
MFKMQKRNPKVLVITMYCGEPQFQRCIESVAKQKEVLCEHQFVKHKPNVEAHRELYEIINNSREDYDFFVKLDADMEFSSGQALIKILSLLQLNTDHLTIPVFDFFINDDMPGLSVFSNRVFFDTANMDNLYVDRLNIAYPGVRQSENKSQQLVYHCYKPSKEQCVAFGVHRALKVCQSDRIVPRLSACKHHYATLRKVYENLECPHSKDIRYFAIIGAVAVFTKRITGVMDDKQMFLGKDFLLDFERAFVDEWFIHADIHAISKALGIFRFFLGGVKTMLNRIERSFHHIKSN